MHLDDVCNLQIRNYTGTYVNNNNDTLLNSGSLKVPQFMKCDTNILGVLLWDISL